MTEEVEICAEILHETTQAYWITDGDIKEWVPKSQVDLDQDGEVGDTVNFTMPEWLAIEKGFV